MSLSESGRPRPAGEGQATSGVRGTRSRTPDARLTGSAGEDGVGSIHARRAGHAGPVLKEAIFARVEGLLAPLKLTLGGRH
jgi:hypothetical protein